MFRSCHISSFLLGLFVALVATQSAEAGLITDEISQLQPATLPGTAQASSAQEDSQQDREKQLQRFEALFGQLTGFAQNQSGASSTGQSVSGPGSGFSPAVLLDVPAISKSILFSYLAEEPELSLSPPFLDGIFRPPTG